MKYNKENNYNNLYPSSTYYPYGELPLKYTKQGQEQLKRQIEQNPATNYENKEVKAENNDAKNNGGLDFNSVLPLLSGIGNNNEMLNKIIPLLKSNGNLQINDLLKLFTGISKATKPETNKTVFSSNNEIDSYKKVE